jgi:hypothetical protein
MKKLLILALPFGTIILLVWWLWSKRSKAAAAAVATAITPAGGTDTTGQFTT